MRNADMRPESEMGQGLFSGAEMGTAGGAFDHVKGGRNTRAGGRGGLPSHPSDAGRCFQTEPARRSGLDPAGGNGSGRARAFGGSGGLEPFKEQGRDHRVPGEWRRSSARIFLTAAGRPVKKDSATMEKPMLNSSMPGIAAMSGVFR